MRANAGPTWPHTLSLPLAAGGARWITGKVHVDNGPMRPLCRAAGFHPKHLTMEFRLEDEEHDETNDETDNGA